MKQVILHSSVEDKLKRGRWILEKDDFPQLDLDNQAVAFYSRKGNFLGTGYLSPQNKGIGWFVTEETVQFDQVFFQRIFQQAKAKRTAYALDNRTTAYRLFNQEGDGFGGVTIDCYGDYAVFSWYNAYVYQLKEVMTAAFKQVYPEVLGAYEKIRFKGLEQESAHLYGQKQEEPFLVLENGVSYQVFLNDGLMTGIFLDQHEVRGSLVDGLAAGKSLLNLFSYTAAFSVAAAMGGAVATTSVDLAKRSRELSEAHFLANGFRMDQHRLVVMDVFDYFKYAKRHGLSYDVIVLDPPSFARNKKRIFSVAKDYHKLIAEALEILEPDGILIASTNAANLSRRRFKEELEKGFGKTKHQYLSEYGLPADFAYNKKDESSNYLKVFTIKVDK
ncbi:class I SAM-dependent rRNA methyltransferase [Streptococcus himalayensis]|uniref:Methyltransferase n=1 Tax=Streptococcus himalayensis TaxID=1888195 RepID=A0A917A7Q3_9STRE|nr:class I SAM-dependent rRNA methyltransferase [Streptococcus himalayensis]GGE33636.1 methyltransferase [Streptococcus himalayensis]